MELDQGKNRMTKKPTGLAAFTNKKVPVPQGPIEEGITSQQVKEKPSKRKRGTRDIVALSVRISRADWKRLHELALDEGISINQLALKGFSRLFKEKGLPGITSE
jgi:hypothetical protein